MINDILKPKSKEDLQKELNNLHVFDYCLLIKNKQHNLPDIKLSLKKRYIYSAIQHFQKTTLIFYWASFFTHLIFNHINIVFLKYFFDILWYISILNYIICFYFLIKYRKWLDHKLRKIDRNIVTYFAIRDR